MRGPDQLRIGRVRLPHAQGRPSHAPDRAGDPGRPAPNRTGRLPNDQDRNGQGRNDSMQAGLAPDLDEPIRMRAGPGPRPSGTRLALLAAGAKPASAHRRRTAAGACLRVAARHRRPAETH